MSEEKPNGTLRYRMDKVEEKVDNLDDKVYKIMTNHLPHLSEDIAKLSTKIIIATGVNVGAIIIGLLISRLFMNTP